MSSQPPNRELEEAVLELQQYLSDSVPPLVVADSMQILMKYPPQAVMPTIRAWTSAQYRGGGSSVPVSDYLFHALKKIHMMGEFKLVAQEPLAAYIETLKPVVLSFCPEEDREMLRENLGRLGETAGASTASQVQTIFRQEGSGTAATASASAARAAGSGKAAGAGPGTGAGAGGTSSSSDAGVAGEALQGIRRFSMLLERLEARGAFAAAGGPSGAPASAGVGAAVAGPAGVAVAAGGAVAPGANLSAASQALAFAARNSHSGAELEQNLARLKEMGLETGTQTVFQALSQSLPGWVVPMIPAAPGAVAGPAMEPGALGAMRRIITEAEDPVEAGKRFHEMVKTGVERFNEGSLPQAVQMFELAERLVSERKVDAGTAEIARRKLGESLDWDQLKKFGEQADQHALLRKVLRFFTDLTPEGILEALPGEPKRDRRRLMLLLLEVHGAPARTAAFERLTHSLGPAVGEEEWFFRRNLLYVLRRIPRTPDGPAFDSEIDVVLQHARLGLPLLVVKEAIAALGQLKDEKTELGLSQLMADLEGTLIKPGDAPLYEAKDLRGLLDRVAATLARLPSRPARRALVEHAQKKQVQLGDTMERLAELGSQNLSEDAETLDQLLALIKANLPFKLLGMTLRQNDQNLVHLIEALSGTPSPAVRKSFEDIVERFKGQEAGRSAARALAAFDRPATASQALRAATSGTFTALDARTPAAPSSEEPAAEPAASLQGDLAVFGLPALLQSLGDSSATGTLTLRPPKGGEAFGLITLREGKLVVIQRGRLRGEDAFYQLFERPTPGQFAFVKGAVAGAEGSPREILPLTLEAMRRYDELQEAAALVPDAMGLEITGTRPTAHPNEKDGGFLKVLWDRVRQGGTASEIEQAVPSDSYRIRRVLAHWLEEGSVRERGGPSAAPKS
jgi:Domain of unknown function (DUF4388)